MSRKRSQTDAPTTTPPTFSSIGFAALVGLVRDKIGTSALKRMSESWFRAHATEIPALVTQAAAAHQITLEGWFFQRDDPTDESLTVSRRYIDRMVENAPMFRQVGRLYGRSDARALAVLAVVVLYNLGYGDKKTLTAAPEDFVTHFQTIHALLLELEDATLQQLEADEAERPSPALSPSALSHLGAPSARRIAQPAAQSYSGLIGNTKSTRTLHAINEATLHSTQHAPAAAEGDYVALATEALQKASGEDGANKTAYYNFLSSLLHEVADRLEGNAFAFQKNGHSSWSLLEEVPVSRFDTPPSVTTPSSPTDRLCAALWRLGEHSLPASGVANNEKQQTMAHVLWAFSERVATENPSDLRPRDLKEILGRI